MQPNTNDQNGTTSQGPNKQRRSIVFKALLVLFLLGSLFIEAVNAGLIQCRVVEGPEEVKREGNKVTLIIDAKTNKVTLKKGARFSLIVKETGMLDVEFTDSDGHKWKAKVHSTKQPVQQNLVFKRQGR